MSKKTFFYGLKGTILRYMSLTSILPLIIGLVMTYFYVKGEILDQSKQSIENSLNSIKKICALQSEKSDKITYDLQEAKQITHIKQGYIEADKIFSRYTNIHFGNKKNTVTAIDQTSGEETQIELPEMLAGNKVLFKNYETVDEVVKQINVPDATATIFQLYDKKLIRISTNVKKNNKRAILTYIPPDSIVYKNISRGKPYIGRAPVVGKWTMTHYRPIKSNNGTVVGAVYFGIPDKKSALFDIISEITIGKSGYVYVIDSQGDVIIHDTLTGMSLLNYKDAKTNEAFAQKMLDKNAENEELRIHAPDMAKNILSHKYSFRDKSGKPVKKLAYFTYFPDWDWIIVAYANYDEILHTVNSFFKIMLILIIVFTIGLIFISTFLATRISSPFRRIIDVAVKVSNGEINEFILQKHYVKCKDLLNCTREDCPAYDSRNLACWGMEGTLCEGGKAATDLDDKMQNHCRTCKVYKKSIRSETDELIDAINHMIVTMQQIVLSIKSMTKELKNDAESLAETSKKLETESQNQAAFIEETTSSNEELTATIESVALSADQQADRASQTSAAMEELSSSTRVVGENSMNVSKETQSTVAEARNTEQMLQTTTKSIDQISESSMKIVDIVAIITEISDQINLLSLNAAIEAARAGDHGRGFAVVSEEISKLADATAQSTKEIEDVIRTSRTDVETGTSLISKTAEAITLMIKSIEKGAALVEEIALSAEEQVKGSDQVMVDIEVINKMSQEIALATDQQKATSAEILKAITSINLSIQEIAVSSEKVATSASSLQDQSNKLSEITAFFNV
ncbi:MAG: methyl-accepting chemotaxis protein [bacterium]|nr:methyl-accepting chemotaxis protein [bacterium]